MVTTVKTFMNVRKNSIFISLQIPDEQTTRQIQRSFEGKYFTIKLEIKSHNIGQKDSSYQSSGIYEILTEDPPSTMDTSRITTANQDSMTQVENKY